LGASAGYGQQQNGHQSALPPPPSAKRRVRAAAKELAGIRSLEKVPQLAEMQGEVAQFLGAAATELKLSPGLADNDGTKERIASRLERIEANCGRRILRGTGVLAITSEFMRSH
jgi:biopolymer transport protein ExbB